jgi:hypothetical protein
MESFRQFDSRYPALTNFSVNERANIGPIKLATLPIEASRALKALQPWNEI